MRGIGDWYGNYAHRSEREPRYDPANDDRPDRVEFGESPQQEWRPRGSRRRHFDPYRRTRQEAEWAAALAIRSLDLPGAIRTWLATHPGRSRRECLQAMRWAGHRGVTLKVVHKVADQVRADKAGRRSSTARSSTTDRAEGSSARKAQRSQGFSHKPAAVRKTHRKGAKVQPVRHAPPIEVPDWRSAVREWLTRYPGRTYQECKLAMHGAGYSRVTLSMVADVAHKLKVARNLVHSATRRREPTFRVYQTPERLASDVCDACGLVVSDDGICRCG
jgi:hypothetical protein